MNSSPLVIAGRYVGDLAQLIGLASYYFFWAVIIGVVLAVALKLVTDALKLNPFGRVAYYANRPGNTLIRHMRDSRFFFPLRRALGFDPAILMVFVAAALLCYVAYVVVGYLVTVLWGVSYTLVAFGGGEVFSAGRYLIGTALLAAIFFLLALMTIVFVNSIFGLLARPAFYASRRIAPLLSLFEFGGVFTGWSFLILFIALTFAAQAVQILFFSNLGV